MEFNKETLESLLSMEEGPTLDFKREQYRFYNATKDDQSKLLKDLLAFVNTHRYRTAYILVGVEEVNGELSKVVGIDNQLEDADLHQFVNSKTNRAAEFSYFPFAVGNKHIGVLRIPIQLRPVYVEKKFGKVDANTVYVRDGSSTRPASPDEIVAMGRGTPPKWSIDDLRSLATNAIVVAVQQWREHPYRHSQFGTQHRPPTYEEARKFVLERSRSFTDYSSGVDSYGSLHWVFKRFEELASYCGQMFRTVGSSLIEYGALIRAMVNVEYYVDREKRVWEEFRIRTANPNAPLPAEYSYNLLVISEVAIRLVDVLGSENLVGDSEYEARRRFAPEVIRQSNEWGDWR